MNGITIVFRSGMSSKSDLRGAVAAGVPIGVVAGHLTTAAIFLTLPRHLDKGLPLFVDSGAFSGYFSGSEIDWQDVLRRYDDIALITHSPENLYVVAPDKVGCQEGTLNLLAKWADRVKDLIGRRVNVIVPIHCGDLPGTEMLDRIAAILGTRQFIAGIPSARAAMSIEECQTLSHHAFHVLGRVQMDEDQIARITALRHNNPTATVTADANWLRSRLATVRRLTEDERKRRRQPGIRWEIDHPRAIAVEKALQEEANWGSPRA